MYSPTNAPDMRRAEVVPMSRAEVVTSTPELEAMWARVRASGDNLNRDKLPWTPELWDRIDQAVHDEMRRTVVGRRFLPLVPSADALTVPADKIIETQTAAPPTPGKSTLLTVNEAAVTEVIEIFVEFALTIQQVEAEASLGTAVTLATRAANFLAQGEDLLLSQGDDVIARELLFRTGKVQTRAGPGPFGLANLADPPGPGNALRQEKVSFIGSTETYGEGTFKAVAKAYSILQGAGHYGPYALVLPTLAYADSYAPLEKTLIMPADRLTPLVEGRFYGTGTLPECVVPPDSDKKVDVGLLISVGGNTVDLVFGGDATTGFDSIEAGLYKFRVFERFGLRDKDNTNRIALVFQQSQTNCP